MDREENNNSNYTKYNGIIMDYILYGQKEWKYDIIKIWGNMDNDVWKMVRNIMECVVEQVMEYEKEKVSGE